MSWPRWGLGPLVTALVLACHGQARAAPGEAPPAGPYDEAAALRVVLVRPADADPITLEALFRIRGELTAEGFSVALVDAPSIPGGADDGAPAAPASGVTIRLTLNTVRHVAELVVTDRLRSKKLTRWIDTRDAAPDHLAEVLAVRSVELVRASLAELSLPGGSPPPAARPPAPPAAPAVPSASEASWGLEAGMSVLVSPPGVGPAALGLARVRFAPVRWLELRVAFAGLGTSPRVDGPEGASARVTQLLVLSEVALRPWPDLRVRPSFALGAGALEVSAEGEALSPYRGAEVAGWSAVLGGGAGAEVRVNARFGVATELRAFAAIPYPSVRFLGEEAARVGVPGLLGSVTLVGWL